MSNKPSLNQIKPNFVVVTIGDKDYYFSYKTIIAFRVNGSLKIIENLWGPTTGKHLNYINPDHSIRIDESEFDKLLSEL